MSTIKQFTRERFERILKEHPEGLRAKELKRRIHKEAVDDGRSNPDYSIGSLFRSFVQKEPTKFGRNQEKGIGTIYYYKDPEQVDAEQEHEPSVPTSLTKHKEEAFYDSFAEYLEYAKTENDDSDRLNECVKAVAWGGNKSGDIWGTPDVVGVFRPKRNALVQFPHEIVSAEIKIDKSSQALITAFGQACAYRLFSHKTYLVIPESGQNADRIRSLCHLFGIGLVYFDPKTEDINFSIYRTELLAQSHTPDMFRVNKFITGKLADQLYEH